VTPASNAGPWDAYDVVGRLPTAESLWIRLRADHGWHRHCTIGPIAAGHES